MVAPSPAPPYVGGTPKRLRILRVAAPPLTKAAHRLGRRRSEENNRGVSRVDGPRRAGGHVARGAGIACSHVSGRLVQSGGLLAQGEFRASMTRNPTPLS